MTGVFLTDLNLDAACRRLVVEALHEAGNIVEAAQLLGISRHACKRLIVKYKIEWPRATRTEASD